LLIFADKNYGRRQEQSAEISAGQQLKNPRRKATAIAITVRPRTACGDEKKSKNSIAAY